MKPSESESPVPGDHELLIRLLRLPSDAAARIREETPPRRRPRRQVGPSAEYGTPETPLGS